MFSKLGDMMQQLQFMQELMKDAEVRELLAHPKVQALMKDPAFIESVKGRDPATLAGHPQLAELMRDPDIGPKFVALQPKLMQLAQRFRA